jgi:hypothetical protein
MTKRLWGGVLLSAIAALVFTATADAVSPTPKPYKGSGFSDPMVEHDLPLFLRSAAETCWIPVHPAFTSPCPLDGPWVDRNGITADEVWCFEGAGGDSTWPLKPGEGYKHWSIFDPPGGGDPKWHITNRQTNPAGGGTYNVYCGCDSVNSGTGDGFCPESAFWIFQRGYGDDWNYALSLDYSPAATTFSNGGTIAFNIRYDNECLYDYIYLEYLNQTTQEWEILTDNAAGGGNQAIFNSISMNPRAGSAAECGFDYFDNSFENSAGDPIHGGGNSGWHAASFPVPNIAVMGGGGTNLDIRWRGFSDGAWSDADGSADTDGMGAIDNVTITLPTPTPGSIVISDNFESNATQPLTGRHPTATNGTATWNSGGLFGPDYDGWHMLFDPTYTNQGNTCTFSDDWMWSGKPQAGFPAIANGFRMYLVAPAFSTDGWTGGVSQYSQFLCLPSKKTDYINAHARWYDTSGTWSLWNDYDGFITFEGCEFWNVNDIDVLTPYLGASVESLQVAWELLDTSREGELHWGAHGSVQYFVDNVSFGSFDGTATVFGARVIDIFADTFSRSDPSHTPFLQNSQQGDWSGDPGGTRDYLPEDSLTVEITDVQGLANAVGTPTNVSMYMRHDSATGPKASSQVWTNWKQKAMDLSIPDNFNAGWGSYRMIVGNDASGAFNAGGEDGDTGSSNIWLPGTTCQYYVRVIDDLGNPSVWPATADDSPPVYFEWSVLPFLVKTDGTKGPFDQLGQASIHILLVDDFTRNALDFENSTGFAAGGGAGNGTFTDPIFDQPEDMVERALSMLYGGSEGDGDPALYDPHWDKYDVQGAGSSVQCEPRGQSALPEIGGYGTDLGVPNYDAMIWLNGTFDEYSYADTTRLQLRTFLNNGGKLFGCGDDVVFHLDANGNNADSTIGFVVDYLGCDLPSSAHDETLDRTLSVVGNGGTSMAGINLGLYGECPIRRSFDRMALSSPTGGTATVLMTYQGGNVADNGTAAVIKCRRNGAAPNGVSVHAAFDISGLLSDDARACMLDAVFTGDFGLPVTLYGNCTKSGVDAPVAGRFGYDLARATPNPFHSSTSIQFSVPNRQHVSIEVYNILGQKVRTLVDETLDPNSYVREWDGRSDNGVQVSSGIYFYKMVAGDYSKTQKTVLLK